MGRLIVEPEYPLYIYINNQRQLLLIDIQGQDGQYTACYADLESTGNWAEAILGLRDQIHVIINKEITRLQMEAIELKVVSNV